MEVDDFLTKIDKIKEDAGRNVLNHFNRINDKIFTFNNILIAGYYAISRIDIHLNLAIILIQLINLVFLIIVEWLMMEKSRQETTIDDLELDEFTKFVKTKDVKATYYSLFSIISTLSVFVYFIWLLLSK